MDHFVAVLVKSKQNLTVEHATLVTLGFVAKTKALAREKNTGCWVPFLERPGNLTGLKSYFEIKVSRKVGRILTSNNVLFVYLADNFTVEFSNLLKLPSGMENKTV